MEIYTTESLKKKSPKVEDAMLVELSTMSKEEGPNGLVYRYSTKTGENYLMGKESRTLTAVVLLRKSDATLTGDEKDTEWKKARAH